MTKPTLLLIAILGSFPAQGAPPPGDLAEVLIRQCGASMVSVMAARDGTWVVVSSTLQWISRRGAPAGSSGAPSLRGAG